MSTSSTLAMLLVAAALLTRGTAQSYSASSSERDDLGAAKAFDGSRDTRWSASFKVKTGWIQVEFPTPRKAAEVRVISGIKDLKGAPKDFDLLAGESAESLQLVKAVKANAADECVVAFAATTAKIWRIDVKSLVNDRWSPTISEIVIGIPATTEIPSSGPKYTASDNGIGGSIPAKAFDGDPSTRYEAQSKAKEAWIQATFPEPRSFNAVRFLSRSESGFGVPRDFTVQAKLGSSWTTLLKATDNWTAAPVRRFRGATAAEWRIVVSKLINDGASLRLSEIEFLDAAEDAPIAWPEAPAPKESDVNKTIERGSAWLLSKRRADGTWDTKHTAEYPMGVMALVGLALLKSGIDRDTAPHPDLVEKLALLAIDKEKTYSVALYAVYLRNLSTKQHVERIKACAEFLVRSQHPEGLWGYPDGRPDLSNAQFALLGLKAAVEVGVEVPEKVWSRAFDYLLSGAEKDGGFNYVPTGPSASDPSTGSMTAAALACLKICVDRLPAATGAEAKARSVRDKALAWLDERFVVELNPQSDQGHYYYLYAVERVGAFFGLKEFGGKNWYQAGARHLLDWQARDGSWRQNIEDTCFALLFLNRASLTSR